MKLMRRSATALPNPTNQVSLNALLLHVGASHSVSVTGLILDEMKAGTPSDRILVAGFSQGSPSHT